jgi:hypothetical protein
MTSLTSYTKQIPANAGYYINVADCRTSFYANTGSDEAPTMAANVYANSSITSTYMATAGNAIFKDMGKTLVSASRVFRKVQLVVNTGFVVSGGTSGVGGVDNSPVNYLTGYIELPGQHGSGSTTGATPVARLG